MRALGHGTEEKSNPRPFEKHEGSGTLKSQANYSVLTYRSGIIQLRAFVIRKKRERVGHPPSFVASTAAPVATGWSEPAPGRDFHPLWISAFSRRTEKCRLEV